MPEDRSLDDFVGVSASTETDEATAEADEESEEARAEADEAAAVGDDEDTEIDDNETATGAEDDGNETVEPPSVTATWATDGVACERCETEGERRWVSDGDYVCADCKDW